MIDIFKRRKLRRFYDEWAEDVTDGAQRVLCQTAADIITAIEDDLADATWKDGLVNPNGFIRRKVAPRVRAVAEPIAIAIVQDANHSLAAIGEVRAVWSRSGSGTPEEGISFAAAGDVAAAVVPLGVGGATAVTLPFAAVTTTTGLFGLVSTSAISWPVVAGGAVVAGVGLVTGAIETTRLWSKLEARLRHRARNYVLSALIKGTPAQPALAEQLAREFAKTASFAKASL
jgi:hypothetical protein